MNTQPNLVSSESLDEVVQAGTKTSAVYNSLKNDIPTGKLKPHTNLRPQTLNKQYNIGNSPLREALNRLCANGIVSQHENKGFRVSPASVDEQQDIVNTRCLLEEIALRQAIEKNDEAHYEKIVLIKYRLSRAVYDSKSGCNSLDKEDVYHEYHQAILSGCG